MNSDNIVDNVVLKCSARLSQPDLQFVKNVLVGELSKYKITLSITQEDSEKVKIFALKNHTTVSDLLHEWIVEKCGE